VVAVSLVLSLRGRPAGLPEWPARNCPPLVRSSPFPDGQEAGGWVTGSGRSGLEEGLAFIKEYWRGWGVVGPVMELAGGGRKQSWEGGQEGQE
jgi:hypothetical protein